MFIQLASNEDNGQLNKVPKLNVGKTVCSKAILNHKCGTMDDQQIKPDNKLLVDY